MLEKDLILVLLLLLTIAFLLSSYCLLEEDKKPGESEFRNKFLARPYLILFGFDILFSVISIINTSGWSRCLSLGNLLIVLFVFYWHERSLQRFYYPKI